MYKEQIELVLKDGLVLKNLGRECRNNFKIVLAAIYIGSHLIRFKISKQ